MIKSKVVIVEDDPYFGPDLKMFLEQEANVSLFINPDSFAQTIQSENISIRNIELIVLDYRFDVYNAWNKKIISYVRELGYKRGIILWSLEEEENISEEFLKQVDGIMPKRLFSLAEAKKCLENYVR